MVKKWTTEKPTEEGFYWLRIDKGEPSVIMFENGRIYWPGFFQTGKIQDMPVGAEWQGPLTPPLD